MHAIVRVVFNLFVFCICRHIDAVRVCVWVYGCLVLTVFSLRQTHALVEVATSSFPAHRINVNCKSPITAVDATTIYTIAVS